VNVLCTITILHLVFPLLLQLGRGLEYDNSAHQPRVVDNVQQPVGGIDEVILYFSTCSACAYT